MKTLLQEGEALLSKIFQAHNAVMLLIDADDGKIIDGNQAAATFYGYSQTELTAMNIAQINQLPPEQIQEAIYAAEKENCNHFVFPHRLASGIIRTVEVHSTPVDIGSRNILFSIIHDISERIEAEEALQKSHDKLEQLVTLRTQALGERVKELHCLYSISKLVEKEQVTLEEIIQGTAEIIPPSWQYPEIACAEIILYGKSYKTDNFTETKWLQSAVVRVSGENNGVVRICYLKEKPELDEGPFLREERALINAIAERLGHIVELMRREEDLRTSNELLRKIFSTTHFSLVILDKDFNFIRVNKTYADACGYPEDYFPGKNHFVLYPNEENETIFQEVVATGEPFTILAKPFEFPDHPEREVTYWDWSLYPIKNSHNDVEILVFALLDVTVTKKAELALRKSEELFRSLIQNALSIILHLSSDGKILEFNQEAERLYDCRRQDVLGKDYVKACLSEESRTMVIANIAKVLHGTPVMGFEDVIKDAEGGNRYVVWNIDRIVDAGGQASGIIAVGYDVTEKKMAELETLQLEKRLQQAQKMEAIGTLAGGIAHDFNNILSIIIGYTEMAIEDTPVGLDIGQYLEQVLNAGGRAKDLVQQILAFSRQGQVAKTAMQPQPIIKEALKMLRSSIPTTIEIQQNIASDCGNIDADPTQLHQIMMNVCTNAFHSMEKKGGVLRVELRIADSVPLELSKGKNMMDDLFMELSISDTGSGIGPDVIGSIFDPFFTTKEKGKGTGMGLAITYGIVRKYGGTITVDSVIGKGTTFHIYLPQSKEDTARKSLQDTDVCEGKERILFVDDEVNMVNLGKTVLERFGYQVTAKEKSFEALEAFKNQPDMYDLVITDHTMPGMTGLEMAGRMLQIRPDIPIILCTGYSNLVNEEVALAKGLKAFVFKPMSSNSIARVVRKVLDQN